MSIENSIPTITLKDLWRFKVDGSVHLQRMHGGAEYHNWSIPLHRHRDLYQLFLITDGYGKVEIDGRRTNFQLPWLLWLPANTVHALEFGLDIDGFLLSISAEYLMAVLSDEYRPIGKGKFFEGVRSHAIKSEKSHLDSLVVYLNSLIREFEIETAEAGIAVESLVRLILISILRISVEEGANAPETQNEDSRVFTQFRRLIEKHYREHLTVREYASRLHVAEQQLHAICKAAVQKPPQSIVHDRLILEARREVLYTSLTISEIAFSLGFEDPAYFSRFFAKRTGVSPFAYRQKLNRAAAGLPRTRFD